MKTAISIDDRLLQEADRAARDMGLSRSRLFSVALREYLHHRHAQEMIEQLNRAYGGDPDPAEQRTVGRMKAKFRSALKERW
jgi:Arc/MetJ family transcription regulator